MVVMFEAYAFNEGPKLVHEVTEQCPDFMCFRQAHDSLTSLLEDQEEMFGFVGAVEVKVLKTSSDFLYQEDIKKLAKWKALVADLDIKKELHERFI